MKSARLVALALALVACSPDAIEETTTTVSTTTTTTTSTTTTTTIAPTTTTTVDQQPVSPLNGLVLEDPEAANRRLLVVKIDNHLAAAPQAGVDQADLVFEVMSEGVTRWMAFFLQSDAEYLGPMRSARPSDAHLLRPLNSPLLARSGAQGWVNALTAAVGINLIGEIGPPATFRVPGRSSPHNLFVNTIELRNASDQRGHSDEPPPAFWGFGPMPDDAASASAVTMRYTNAVSVDWVWDEESQMWHRSGYGRPSVLRDREGVETPVAAPVLIALVVDYSMISAPPGFWGTPVPGTEAIGSGQAFIFADGKVTEGTWERGNDQEWFRLIGPDGEPMLVPPGKAWVSLVSRSHGLLIEP